MVIIKLTDEDAAKLGVKSTDDLVALAGMVANEKERADLAESNRRKSMTELETLTNRVAALEGKAATPAVNVEDIVKKAVEAATSATMGILAKVGGNALPAPAKVEDVSAGKPAIAPDDYAGQYKADPKLQEEFSTEASYVAFAKALAAGRVRIPIKS